MDFMHSVAKHPFITAALVILVIILAGLSQQVGPNRLITVEVQPKEGIDVCDEYKIPQRIQSVYPAKEAVEVAKAENPRLKPFNTASCMDMVRN